MPPEAALADTPKRRLYIKTWGCQMNVYDSDRMTDVLRPLGYETVDSPEHADLAILNTCHIREKATEKVFSDLGRLRAHKQARQAAGSGMIVAVAGCVAQAEGEEILARAPAVDLIFGPQAYHQLPGMIAEITETAGRSRIISTDFAPEAKFDALMGSVAARGPSAFLSIQEGCNKFCSFCVVPYTRGAEYSRPASDIVKEARLLLSGGAREITLLGQNVNAWHGEAPGGGDWRLGRLLRELAALPGVERLRYMTSHPSDMDDDLIAAHADIPQLMPFLHLPVQSGSDRILALMNRKHTADDYLRIVDRARAARPDIALSSDFIVGYPGETVADFEATLALVQKAGFASSYSFSYSPRAGTPAMRQGLPVPDAEKNRRLEELQTLLLEQQLRFNQGFLGKTVAVLVDRASRVPGQMHGRTPHMQALHVNLEEHYIGHTVQVRVTEARAVSLCGTFDGGI